MENEVLDIVEKLLDRYGIGMHWEIVEIKKTGHFEDECDGYSLVIKKIKQGAKDESNK